MVDGLKYDMLLSRRAMKDFKMNLHHDDTISFADAYERRISMRSKAQLKRGFDTFDIETVEVNISWVSYLPLRIRNR